MYKLVKSSIPLLLIFFTLFGCALINKDRDNGELVTNSPIILDPNTTGGQNSKTPNTDSMIGELKESTELDWRIEYRDDPSIRLSHNPTHLPAERLVFIATFNQAMNTAAVEEAFQSNLLAPNQSDMSSSQPTLEFKWYNPLQVEVIVPGAELSYFTLSPKGAVNKDGNLELLDDKQLTIVIYPKHVLYKIDQLGKLSKPITTIPNSLFPLSQSPDGKQLLLARSYYLETEGPAIPYLFDIQSNKIVRILPEGDERPFWGNDNNLYTLKNNALIRLSSDEEQWIEFGEYPYIHGWSISPDLQYEVFLLSKNIEPKHTKITIMIRDLQTLNTKTYEDILPMNDLDSFINGIMHYPIKWMTHKQIFLSTYLENKNRSLHDYVFDLETGELTKAPQFLQIESYYGTGSPTWSMDQQYIAINEFNQNSGIYDFEGNLLYNWSTYQPSGGLYWSPTKHIVAYESVVGTDHFIVQYDLEIGKTIITEGNYTILGWTEDGSHLQVYTTELR